ncbi:MAG: hypothetical protein K6C09_08130 [Oscillospiraceae bacterium]|nr:hypothetical protein [Oscillospiraceae bacterium]
MTGFAELFMTDEEGETQTLPQITDIPRELTDDFPAYPFKVRMDDDMQQLVESIREEEWTKAARYKTISAARRLFKGGAGGRCCGLWIAFGYGRIGADGFSGDPGHTGDDSCLPWGH